MALSETMRSEAEKDLKQDMKGTAEEEKVNQKTPSAGPAPNEEPPVRMPTSAVPKSTPASATDSAALAKINQRLEGLDRDLAELMENFESYSARTFNYGPIFTKLEAVQTDLEKLLTAQPEQDKSESQDQVEELLKKLLEKQENNDRQLVRYLRENTNFQVQVRQQMQGDLDKLREQQSGSLFNPMLKEVASMYADYQMLLEDEGMSQKTRKNLLALFGQMEDLLMDYEAEVCVSKVGEERPKHRCRIITQIPTGDKSRHNTIAKSRKPGVMRGRLVLAHEFVDVYVYDPNLDPELNAPKDDTANGTEDQLPTNKDHGQNTQQTVPGGATEKEPPVGDASAKKTSEEEPPTAELPAGDAPTGDASAKKTSEEEPPAAEPPAGDAPTGDASAKKTSEEEPPAAEPPAGDAPTGDASAEKTSEEKSPAAELPAGDASTGDASGEETSTAEVSAKHSKKQNFFNKLFG